MRPAGHFTANVLLMAILACSAAGVAVADDGDEPHRDRGDGLIEELYFADVASVQEKGAFQLTLSLLSERSPEKELGSLSNRTFGNLTLEFGVTDRLQVAVGAPVLQQTAHSFATAGNDLEIGVAYDLSTAGGPALVAAAEFERHDPSAANLRVASRVPLGNGEIHSGIALVLGNERHAEANLAGVFPVSRLLAILELHHDSRAPGSIRMTPGLSWIKDGLQIGVAVAFSSAPRSEGLLMLKTAFTF